MRLLALFYNALPVRWQRRILDRTQARFLVGVVGLGEVTAAAAGKVQPF